MTTGYSVQPNKAVVGLERVRARERHPPARRARQPRDLRDHGPASRSGWRATQLVLGKHSGRHAFIDALDKLGITLDDGQLNRAFTRFKDLADRKVQLTDQDLSAIVAEELGATDEDVLVLESLQMGGGTHLQPRATVRLTQGRGDDRGVRDRRRADRRRDGRDRSARAGRRGSTRELPRLGVTGGTDALGDVVVQLDIDGRRVTGRGVATDVVEASARAYLAAVNRALQVAGEGREAQTNEVTPVTGCTGSG